MKKILILSWLVCLTTFTEAQSVEWATSVPYGSGYASYNAVVHDNDGNVFVAGHEQADESSKVFYIKYDNKGSKLWEKNDPGNWPFISAATDNSGNFYRIREDFRKMDKSGNTEWNLPCFARIFMSKNAGPDNNLIVTGSLRDTAVLGNITLIPDYKDLNKNNVLAKFDPAGKCLWAIRGEGSQHEKPYINNKGEIFVTDYFTGKLTLGKGKDTVTMYGRNIYDCYMAKYDPNGNLMWANKMFVYCFIAPDAFGNVYTIEKASENTPNWSIAKYDQNGKKIWDHVEFNQGEWSKGNIECGSDGSLYLSFGFAGYVSLGGQKLTSTSFQVFVAKIDSSGTLKWITASKGGATTKDLTVMGKEIFVTGDMASTVTFGDKTVNQSGGGTFIFKMIDDNSNLVGLSEKKTEATQILIYPNPSNNTFSLKLNDNISESLEIKVMNIGGQIVYSNNTVPKNTQSSTTLDLSGFQKGAYFVTITGKTFTETKKIILE